MTPETAPYRMILGDCVEEMERMPEKSVDFSVFSPPFPSLYAYTSSPADVGNSDDLEGEAKVHLSFFFRRLKRVMAPGRAAVVHCAQIPRMKRSGGQGLFDFRGLVIRLGERAGLVYEYDWAVRKNPQAQALRGKAWELKFQGLETDRVMSRGALADYLVKFRAPGDNARALSGREEVGRDDWIEWAECTWDVKETDTLNVKGTKGDGDTKHICPLQLPVIDRLIRLYSGPGELVFSPFAGIGSEGYQAVLRGRRFLGVELKREYHAKALENLARAARLRKESQKTLFDPPPEDDASPSGDAPLTPHEEEMRAAPSAGPARAARARRAKKEAGS